MIRAAFGIKEVPFSKEIKTQQLFVYPQFSEFCARLKLLCDNRGIGLFTGDVGCGKSTAIRSVLESLSPQTHRVVYLYRGMDNTGAFYTQVAAELGIVPKFRKPDVANQVLTAIAEFYIQQKIQTVLVIDEAHLLKPEIFDEIRLLHNNQYDSCDYLTTALVGQPPLKKMITLTKYLPLRQRISVAANICALTKEQALQYFAHQLHIVNASKNIFMDNAVETIVTVSKGIPRMINSLALKSMYHAVIDKKTTSVDQETVMDVLDELGLK
jgi:type II secretory pathway predicted ATPase ExeA